MFAQVRLGLQGEAHPKTAAAAWRGICPGGVPGVVIGNVSGSHEDTGQDTENVMGDVAEREALFKHCIPITSDLTLEEGHYWRQSSQAKETVSDFRDLAVSPITC